jgi:hypothetical protein
MIEKRSTRARGTLENYSVRPAGLGDEGRCLDRTAYEGPDSEALMTLDHP